MKSTPFFLIDAFTQGSFTGNPAGVCLLHEEAEEEWMQNFAAEVNQAETAFVVPKTNDQFGLRWFTPTVEVDLCGHATLASAVAVWHSGLCKPSDQISFATKSGILTARQEAEVVWLDFPAIGPKQSTLETWFESVWTGTNGMDWFAMLESESAVREFKLDIPQVRMLGMRGLAVTALAEEGKEYDFVSRFFAPQSGVDEDSVTGSMHSALCPYWAAKTGRNQLTGFQASPRGGIVRTQLADHRVLLGGESRIVVEGFLR